MGSSRLEGDIYVAGALACQSLTAPAGSITKDAVKAAAGVEATKLEHQHVLCYQQNDGSDIVAATVPLWTVRGNSATIVAVEVACIDAPSGGDKAFSVDLQKCNEGSPVPATVLTSVINYSSSQSDCEVEAGTISSASLSDGDTLVLDVGVSGSSGNQGQGLIVTVTVREDAE